MQSNLVVEFLRSCSRALRAECKENGETIVEGLERELGDIERGLSRAGDLIDLKIQFPLLQLTQSFYQALSECDLREDSFEEAVESVLVHFRERILAINLDDS